MNGSRARRLTARLVTSALALALVVLGGCARIGSGQLALSPTPDPTAAADSPSASPSSSPGSTSATPTPDGPAPQIYVEGVTITLCSRCLALAELAGVDLEATLTRSVRHAAGLLRLPEGSLVEVRIIRPAEEGTLGHAFNRVATILLPEDVVTFQRFQSMLPRTVAHELHHLARLSVGPGRSDTLGDQFVIEGTAVAFEDQAYPLFANDYWEDLLDAELEHTLWQEAQPHLFDPLSLREYRRWFNGEEEIPDAAGYAIGHGIVQDYLALHPVQRPSDLALVDYREIIQASGYDP